MRFSKQAFKEKLRETCRDFRKWFHNEDLSKSTPTVKSVWEHEPFWETCERRLALSALPWMPFEPTPVDVSSVPNTLLQHDVCISPEFALAEQSSNQNTPPLETNLAEAHNQTGWNQIHSNYGLTGQGQTVAVIDSGIAFDHVALGKGFGPNYRVVGGWDFAENDARPYDDAPGGFHGTHVAGIIGANDGVHYGVAPNVDLVALRVFNDQGKGEISWAENALKWVHDNRNKFENPITTVNLSLGANWNSSMVPNWATLEEELGQLNRDGIVVVVSAGNSFQQFKLPGLSYPAASPFVIPVSSIDANGQLSDFSQREARSIAAPGRSIESTVPDYFYGKDGIANDWANASGTSMAAPYIAGASVLVREAMELAGIKDITPQSIYEHLKSTSNAIWDSITSKSYMSLDLDRAVESLIPKDTIGDTLGTAQSVTVQNSWQSNSWINTLGDEDVYRLHATQSGTVSVQLDSKYLDDAEFSLLRGSQQSNLQLHDGKLSFTVNAGETVGMEISDHESIGTYRLNWSFVSTSPGGGSSVPTKMTDLGTVDFLDTHLSGNSQYHLIAEHTGLMSVVVDANSNISKPLQLIRAGGPSLSDSSIDNGQLRLDIQVVQGQAIDVVLPHVGTNHVRLVNLVEQHGQSLTIHGSEASERVTIDLRNGLNADISGVEYRWDAGAINSIQVRGDLNQDSLKIFGSVKSESVEMRPGIVTVIADTTKLSATQFESVQYYGGGGLDRATLYDGNSDDRLNIQTNRAEFSGNGFSNSLYDVDRISAYASQGGNDTVRLLDSSGNDVLVSRQQFTTLTGTGFANYVAGFEKIIVDAQMGGTDRATIYDSNRDDVLIMNKQQTSIYNSGQSLVVRGFDSVEAWATSGGNDRATVQATDASRLKLGHGSAGFAEGLMSGNARNFESVQTIVTSQLTLSPMSVASMNSEAFSNVASIPLANSPVYGPARLVETSSDPIESKQAPLPTHVNAWISHESETRRSWSDWMTQDPPRSLLDKEHVDWLGLDTKKVSVDALQQNATRR